MCGMCEAWEMGDSIKRGGASQVTDKDLVIETKDVHADIYEDDDDGNLAA